MIPLLFNGSIHNENHGTDQEAVIVTRDVTQQKRIATKHIEAIVFTEKSTLIAEEAKLKAVNV